MKRKNLILVALIIGIAFAYSACTTLAKDMTVDDFKTKALKHITQISPVDAKALFDKGVVFVDVKEPDEFQAGHIRGAKNIPRGTVEWMVPKQVTDDKNATMVVYCEHGSRGMLAAYALVQMGYKNAKNLEGGRSAWEKAGFPLE
ncbi:MAG: sulfurtransferase [Deltaproteobacteria bacterium]|nr:sulfurtransferase [Deltaproteobacteria bacterium]